MTSDQPGREWKLVIHGGAGVIERGRMTPELERNLRAGLEAALEAGAAILGGGGSAVDAVEAAARTLENDVQFNAGRGAVLTFDGETELDAAIMEGSRRDAGAVAGVSNTRNPISLARAVMEKSPHVFLGSRGADRFAEEQGLEQAPPGYFDIPERRRQLEELKANDSDWFDVDMKFGTIGAVALDSSGHVAAATSTGGITGKRWGRIGDSPLIGAGTWADDRSCAVSATGSGEYFIRAAVAHEIAARIRFLGESAQAAADAVMADVKELGGNGGVIVVSAGGETVYSFNSEGMYRGTASPSGRSVAIYGDE
ncbi:MAG: Isoaspartyl aminopeptidase @ Asp-X dipeptidase [uncultured Sphingosinicella sp.]|uniref:Isoaspartyl peptidase n=1 Tax=uncultured Sphingosinicella sp. TaxID=478748 RepID=A0A6J4U500_9SPHN|nr:isoaspartyl peptidase/L-asparaginase [uncultured Sphingosinicella sp.]CAA9540613.1 MAG: Isoaspartyl aminopeptidase @ Asp-X dipeptidase [uncultured Sphingosinicella sp.]